MSAQDDIVKQILGQNLTSKWSGEGYGGAEANAKAMAKLLADAGITDIKQFGKVDKYEPVEVTGYTLNGNTVQSPSKGVFYEQIPQYDGEGGIQGYQRRDLSADEIAKVQPQYGIVESDADGGRVVRPVDKVTEKDGQLLGVTGTTFGNKETGQEITRGSGRWLNQGGDDLFSGTGEGEGNTGFRVQFREDGTPIFYTTQGSSSDMGSIAPLLTMASFIPGVAPFAQGLNALMAAKQGNILGAVAGAAGLGGFSEVANAAKLAGALKSGDPLAIAMAGANVGGVTNVGGVDLKDISKTIGAAKAIESGDPLAILRYGMDALPKDGGVSSFGPGTPEEFSNGLIPGYFQPGGEGYIAREVTNPLGPTEEFNPAETDWASMYNTGLTDEEIAKREALMGSLPGQEMQIDPKNWESYNNNLIDIVNNKGGYTSQWQTVGNDRVMINDDGTGIGTNENGDSYALSPAEVSSMVKNGMLNTAGSGYVAATGGTGNTPGGSAKAPAPAAKAAPTKPGAKTPATGTNPAVDAIANAAAQQQNQQNALLNMMASDKAGVANIKSFKDLYGEDLFGGSYVPPSALGADDGFSGMPMAMPMPGMGQEQDTGNDGFSNGGHVDDFSVDALLQILRG